MEERVQQENDTDSCHVVGTLIWTGVKEAKTGSSQLCGEQVGQHGELGLYDLSS